MSYCRWSSDHGECDVYVYADVAGGWTTHVAGRRLRHRVPDAIRAMFPNPDDPDFASRWMVAHGAERAWRESLPSDEFPCVYYDPKKNEGRPGTYRTPKDSEFVDLVTEVGPEAGRSYNDPTPGACADRLEELRAKGFNVPQRAIDALREEQADGEKS